MSFRLSRRRFETLIAQNYRSSNQKANQANQNYWLARDSFGSPIRHDACVIVP
jgi:hypothetical protein